MAQRHYYETHHVNRWLSWPLVACGGLATGIAGGSDLGDSARRMYVVGILFVSIGILLLLEFVGPVVEIEDGELRFWLFPLFRYEVDLGQIREIRVGKWEAQGNYVPFRSQSTPPGFLRRGFVPPTHYVEVSLFDEGKRYFITNHPYRLKWALEQACRQKVTA
jgi:hypothetical protein